MKPQQSLIWDIPTRLFHWLLVIGLFLQWLTGEYLDDSIDWHFTIGYCMLGLVLFRVVWGVIGTRYAKFSNFLTSPSRALKYAKTLPDKDSKVYAGHNPLGGYVVIIMLLLIALQAISGLFVSDEIFSEGPYRSLASEPVKEAMEFIHFNLFNALLAIVGVHVIAVFVYQLYKKQKLIIAMLNGRKNTDAESIKSSKLWLALVLAVAVAGAVYTLVAILPPQPDMYF